MSEERVQRLVFGEAAEDYDRHRPHYPDEVFSLLLARTEPDAVLDIGSGTGRVATSLATRGLPGHAVEPDPAMAVIARNRLPDTWTVEVTDFETCTAAGRDDWPLITCGQAWHWIDDDAGFAKAAQLLAPGGMLALFWNRPTFREDELRREMDEIYDRHAPDMRSSLRGRGTEPKGVLHGTVLDPPPPGFDSSERVVLSWEHTYTTDAWVGLLATHSDHRMLEPGARHELHQAVREAIDRHGGAFTLPYRVDLVLLVAGAR